MFKETLPPSLIKKIFNSVFLGLYELHFSKIIHCDIKPNNILLSLTKYNSVDDLLKNVNNKKLKKEDIHKFIDIKIIDFNNDILSKLGFMVNGTYILPSVEIAYFMSLGMEVVIDAGVFGAPIDFDFTEDMLLKGEDGVPRYSKWSGTLGSENWNRNYTFKCDSEWAGHLKSELNAENVFYWEKLGVCSIKMPIENVYTTHHILAFITSYVRIQMIQTMMKFDSSNLVRVVMDGLYYKGDLPNVDSMFTSKEIKECDYSEYWYKHNDIDIDWDSNTYSRNTLLCGGGGNGKTYKVLNDIGLNKILFVAPMNLLGKGVASQYKIRSTTIHKLLGKEFTGNEIAAIDAGYSIGLRMNGSLCKSNDVY